MIDRDAQQGQAQQIAEALSDLVEIARAEGERILDLCADLDARLDSFSAEFSTSTIVSSNWNICSSQGGQMDPDPRAGQQPTRCRKPLQRKGHSRRGGHDVPTKEGAVHE